MDSPGHGCLTESPDTEPKTSQNKNLVNLRWKADSIVGRSMASNHKSGVSGEHIWTSLTLSSFCSKHVLQTHCTLQKSAGQPLEAAPIPPESLNQQHADTLWDRMIKTATGGHWSCPDSVSPAQSPYAMQASPASTNGTKHHVTMYFQVISMSGNISTATKLWASQQLDVKL